MSAPPENGDQRIAFICFFLGLFLLLFGLTSYLIRGKLFLSTAVVAVLIGIALGSKGLDLLRILPASWEVEGEDDRSKSVLLWFTRIILGIQVLSAGITLPNKLILRRRVQQSLAILLGPVMLMSVFIVGGFAKLLFPDLGWLECFVIAACLAPTDPVLAASVVKGTFADRHVPPYIRDLLLCESGINDGTGTTYWILPVLLITSSHPARSFLLEGVLWETLFPIATGFLVGTTARLAWKWAESKDWMDKESRLVWTLALALFTVGLFTLIDSNELIACFFCGSAMNWDGELHEDDLHSHFSEGIDAILDVSVFTTLGTVLPWDVWFDLKLPVTISRLVGFGFLVILLRRLPVVMLLWRWIPEVRTIKEAVFVGWFGPMGIGALYFSLKAAEEMPPENVLKQQLFGIVSWIVFTSIMVHGITIPFFLLGSSLHPSFHPKFLLERGGDDSGSVASGPTEQTSLLGDADEGEPLRRSELLRIMSSTGDNFNETLNSGQREVILGQGSGLKGWGRGKIRVYNQGSDLVICDENGDVSVRKIISGNKMPSTV